MNLLRRLLDSFLRWFRPTRHQPDHQAGLRQKVSEANAEPNRTEQATPDDCSSRTAGPDNKRAGTGRSRPSSTVNIPGRQRTDLILGLDFGTSCSKVVIRTPFLAGGRALAIPLGSGSVGGPPSFLIPTGVHQAANGSLKRGSHPEKEKRWASLKLQFMEQPSDHATKAKVAAFLALVIRESRGWYLKHEAEVLSPYELNWKLNLGIPSAGYDDDDLKESFRSTALAAWRLAEGTETITLERAHAALSAPSVSSIEIGVIPEVVAGVVGYARSQFREPGLHVLVDVGASTLDICGFILWERHGEQVNSLLTASVELKGAHILHRRRVSRLTGNSCSAEISNLDLGDPYVEIPGSIEDYLNDKSLIDQYRRIDVEFLQSCTKQLMTVMNHLHKRRYRTSPHWKEGVPLFLSGGGGTIRLYRDVAGEASYRCHKNWKDVARLRIGQMPNPPQVANKGFSKKDYARVAVAYGLSFDEFDIGDIIPPHQIPDQDPPRRRDGPDPITKDQV